MKLVFASNYLTPHQVPFCLEMVDAIGVDNFSFIATTPFDSSRVLSGYVDMNSEYDWTICAYESEEQNRKALSVVKQADVAILTPDCEQYCMARKTQHGLTFLITERLLKRGDYWRYFPLKAMRTYRRFLQYKNDQFYVLCNGAYVSRDLALSGFPAQKCLMWGYFPDVPQDVVVEKSDSHVRLLWTGRMIGWKHPLDAVKCVERLKAEVLGVDFELSMIGDGSLFEEISEYVYEKNLGDVIRLIGALPNELAIREMKSADIFLATSDKDEGWGAVINEAMASGCAVVASDMMGASHCLIDSDNNGYIYRFNDKDALYKHTKTLLLDAAKRKAIQENAINTIRTTWTAAVAVKRLLLVSKGIMQGKVELYKSGPCSLAQSLKD